MKPHLRTTIETLLEGGASHREIERRTGVDRKTIRRYARAAKSPLLKFEGKSWRLKEAAARAAKRGPSH